MIDNIGGVYPPLKIRSIQGAPKALKPTQSNPISDNISISADASRAAALNSIRNEVSQHVDPMREAKLAEVKAKLENNAYDKLSTEQLSTTADSILRNFFPENT